MSGSFLFIFLGLIICPFTLLSACICLFFAIPFTLKKIKNGQLNKEKGESIIIKYSISTALLLSLYILALFVVYSIGGVKSLNLFIVGSLLSFVLGRIKGPMFFNKNNENEYNLQNKNDFSLPVKEKNNDKILSSSITENESINLKDFLSSKISGKELIIDNSKMEKLSADINQFLKNDLDITFFMNIFPNISIKDNSSMDLLLKEKKFDRYSDNISFCHSMKNIIYPATPEAYLEFFVFNFYTRILFYNYEYGGRILLSNIDKEALINMKLEDFEDDNTSYRLGEKQLIKKINIPQKILIRENGSILIHVYEADNSFAVTEALYEINKNNEIILQDSASIIDGKLLF